MNKKEYQKNYQKDYIRSERGKIIRKKNKLKYTSSEKGKFVRKLWISNNKDKVAEHSRRWYLKHIKKIIEVNKPKVKEENKKQILDKPKVNKKNLIKIIYKPIVITF
jgi:predicted alpha-1,6-mannanase (GH76 family)